MGEEWSKLGRGEEQGMEQKEVENEGIVWEGCKIRRKRNAEK